jgi:tryptophanyl-tRNA synthetase
MRPTGGLHLGHWRGVLHNWRALQEAGNECFFFIADWHALTTDYANPGDLFVNTREMVLSWLSAGLDPQKTTMFRQSDVPAHAELFVLLSMICPLPWLMHLPTYKEQKEALQRDLDTHGFLGYPLLQSADIMIYGADCVPVGEDQVPHVEFTRDIARRFNRFYGNTEDFQSKLMVTKKSLSVDVQTAIETYQKDYQQNGNKQALDDAVSLIDELVVEENTKQLLRDDVRYGGQEVLRVPQAMLTQAPRLPGTDGRKMSKSYGNTIDLTDVPEAVEKKIARMQTDPARVRRSDKGEPTRCPVWSLHRVFSDMDTQNGVAESCRSAAIGCVDCKKRLSAAVNDDLEPLRERRAAVDKTGIVEDILADGALRAAKSAEQTMQEVRRFMHLVS